MAILVRTTAAAERERAVQLSLVGYERNLKKSMPENIRKAMEPAAEAGDFLPCMKNLSSFDRVHKKGNR